jgi:hypothetical protein
MHRDGHGLAMARQVLVHCIVDRFPHQMVERRAVVHVTDVHTGTLADGLEPLQHGDAFRVVRVGLRRRF